MITLLKEASSNSSRQFLNKKGSKVLEKTKQFIFDCLIRIFQPQFTHSKNYQTQVIIEIITNFIMCLQAASIFWYPGMTLDGWDNYFVFWKYIWIFNYDCVCVNYNIYIYCFAGQILAIFYSIFTFLLYFAIKALNWKFPKIFIAIAKEIISFFATVGLIPLLSFLFIIFKYSTFKVSRVQEYYESSPESFDYGPIGSIICIITFGLIITIAAIYELFTADLKHTNSDRNLRARSNSTLSLLWILFCVIQVALFISLNANLIVTYLIIILIMAIFLFIKYIFLLPYYSTLGNSIHAGKMAIIATYSIAFIFSYINNNALVLTLLCIFLPPFSVALEWIVVSKNYSKLSNTENPLSSQYRFEHSMRNFLINKNCDNREEVIEIISHYSNNKLFTKNGLFVIWEVNFFIHVVKDERIGRIKLTKFHLYRPSLEGSVQKLRMSKKFDEKEFTQLNEIEYLRYLTDLHKAKRKDRKICYVILNLWAEIARKAPKIQKLRFLTEKFSDLATQTKQLYRILAEKNEYPEIFDLYGNFLINILGDVDEGNLILKRKFRLKEDSVVIGGHHKRLEEYGEKFGIILLSTEPKTIGSISFINEKAAMMLKVSSTEIIGTSLNNFIPWPYSINHNEKLKKFYSADTKTTIDSIHTLILQDNYGYIFECNILIKLTAFKDKAYFMVSFSPIFSNRQVILVSKEGEIYNHSSHLSTLLGCSKQNMSKEYVFDIARGLEWFDMKLYEPFAIKCNGIELLFVHIIRAIKSSEIHLVLVVSNTNEIEKWRHKASDEQLEFYNNKTMSFIEIPKLSSEKIVFEEKNSKMNSGLYSTIDDLIKINSQMESNAEIPEKNRRLSVSINESTVKPTCDGILYIETAYKSINSPLI